MVVVSGAKIVPPCEPIRTQQKSCLPVYLFTHVTLADLHLFILFRRRQMDLSRHHALLGIASNHYSTDLRRRYSLALSQTCILGDHGAWNISLAHGYRCIAGNNMVDFSQSDNGNLVLWNSTARRGCFLFHYECTDRLRHDALVSNGQPGEIYGDQESASGVEAEAGRQSAGTFTRSWIHLRER